MTRVYMYLFLFARSNILHFELISLNELNFIISIALGNNLISFGKERSRMEIPLNYNS